MDGDVDKILFVKAPVYCRYIANAFYGVSNKKTNKCIK